MRNVAQCHRELRQFAEAYDSLALLLSRHGSQLKDSDKAEIKAALEELEGVTATLTLNVSVPGAAITIDDRDAGTSPFDHKIRLNVGSHRIRASKPGFDPAELQITLLVRQDAVETMTLKPAAVVAAVGPVAARPLGHMRIKVMPAAADILVDGERVASGRFEGDFSEGDHALDVAAQGFVSVHRTFRLGTGQQVVENVALDPYVPEKPPAVSLLGKLYGTFDVALLRHINGYQPLLTACGDQEVTCNQPSYPGGGALIHVGYAFDWVGVELVGAFGMDVRSESMTATGSAATSGALVLASSNVQRSESLSAVGFGGFLGLGLRATSSDSLVRVTAGLSPGLSLRHYTLSRTLSNGIDATYADEGTAAAVGLMTDVGLVIGTPPGPRFRIGLALWMDFPQGNVLSSGGPPLAATANGQAVTIERPAYVLQSGSQFLIGPTLGVQFGR